LLVAFDHTHRRERYDVGALGRWRDTEPDNWRLDIVAGYQPVFIYESCDVFESEAVSESPLDEAKTLEMFNLKTEIVGACALSFGRWE
jgi:hypothetical protein